MTLIFGGKYLYAAVKFDMENLFFSGALFVATIGLANLFGRFAWGALSNLCSFVSPVTLFICLRLAASVLTFFSPLASSFGLHMTFCVTAGLTFGCWSLYPLMVAKLFGKFC